MIESRMKIYMGNWLGVASIREDWNAEIGDDKKEGWLSMAINSAEATETAETAEAAGKAETEETEGIKKSFGRLEITVGASSVGKGGGGGRAGIRLEEMARRFLRARIQWASP